MNKRNQFNTMILAVGVLGLSACKHNSASISNEDKSIVVITEQISETTHHQHVSVSGNIEGNKTVKLGFMVGGKINGINFSEGQNVGEGQLVATLDPTNYNIAKEIADVQVGQVTDEYNRLQLMHERNSVSESDFKKIDFALQGARAQQKLQVKNLSDTRLYSPISGIVLRKLAEPGEIVATGSVVMVVSDIRTVKVNAYIPENQLSQIKIGQSAEVTIGALGENITGKVIEVGGAADVSTRAFTVKIEIENPKQKIRPGMIAEINMDGQDESQVLTIPAQAILRTPDGQPFVFIVSNGQAFQRNISTGSIYGDRIEIVSGLSANEFLIVGGQQKLSNGSKITSSKK